MHLQSFIVFIACKATCGLTSDLLFHRAIASIQSVGCAVVKDKVRGLFLEMLQASRSLLLPFKLTCNSVLQLQYYSQV